MDGVSLDLAEGEALAVVGESGCGKSMLARTLLGLPPAGAHVSGTILLGGQDLSRLPEAGWRPIRGGRIALVFQEPGAAFDPVRTVGSQIVEAARRHGHASRRQARDQARALLAEVSFPDADRVLDEYPHRLSGGQRQRAFLAMALAGRPRVLVADEPTASLDATVAAQVLELLGRLRRERGLSLILITHDMGIVARHTDRALVLYAGKTVEEAETSELFRAPRHPYTRGLLRCVPRLVPPSGDRMMRRFEAIPGSLPDLSRRVVGACAFAPRCPDRFAPCDRREPELFAAGRSLARCFLYENGAASEEAAAPA